MHPIIYIAAAINGLGTAESGLWNEEDGLYYDVIHLSAGDCAGERVSEHLYERAETLMDAFMFFVV